MQLILFIWFIFYNSTCFGRSPRPSSGVICLQTVVAATGVCYWYGVDKSRIGVIGSVFIIPGSIDVDVLVMLLVSNVESSFYIITLWYPALTESMCLESVSGHICNCYNVLC